ncbi:MAG: ankyrin repeat domain-containing protein [Myxococcota bacterium]
MRKALAMGVAPDERWHDDGDTALALAARGGHAAVVRALLDAGADPDLLARGEPPIATAVGPLALDPRARRDVVRALAAGGADVDRRDADGLTPLMRAVLTGRGDARAALALLELGADLDAAHPSGLTALELAQGDPAKAALARALADWAAKGEAADARARVDVTALRGIGDAGAACVALAVRAPIDDVAQALERRRGGRQWSRDVYGRDGYCAGDEGIVVFRFRGHDWTLAQSACMDARALRARDAEALSRQLGCAALLYEACEDIGLLRYALYEGGERVERLGLRRDGGVAFESSREPAPAAPERDGLVAFLGDRLRALGLYVPGVGDDRLADLARRFAPRDFERVDYLRLDVDDAPGGAAR